jgi:hypothetical protein
MVRWIDCSMTTPRINWHGQDLAAVTEHIKLGEVETFVEVPAFDEPELRHSGTGVSGP